MSISRKKLVFEFLVLFLGHYVLSHLGKSFVFKTIFNWKMQLIESILFSIFIAIVFGFFKKRNNTRKNK